MTHSLSILLLYWNEEIKSKILLTIKLCLVDLNNIGYEYMEKKEIEQEKKFRPERFTWQEGDLIVIDEEWEQEYNEDGFDEMLSDSNNSVFEVKCIILINPKFIVRIWLFSP